MLAHGNLFDVPARSLPAELHEELAAGTEFRLERIVSTGHATPPGEWYDQPDDEWVLLVTGSATLTIAGPEPTTVALAPGDWIHLPAHHRHRVEQTAAQEPTVWLALHTTPPGPL